ncbi:MAG TPA: hypothetical protein VGE47_15725 [Burkholderiaceae bacterium]
MRQVLRGVASVRMIVEGLAGGWVAARLAARSPSPHGIVNNLAILLPWFWIASLAVLMPSVWLGAQRAR